MRISPPAECGEAVDAGSEVRKSLASDDFILRQTAPLAQHRFQVAARLDREADQLLFEGRHANAERLSHLATELREATL